MEQATVKRLALVLAVQAEIEGMKAANYTKGYNVFENDSFEEKALQLRNLAYCHDDQL